ncbi:precorrin-3B synthase [Methylobacterium sp. J-068]|uniref:precorrin-3B synthase n=1 Tax=Methylobacterium sp. J-068 TaxID=2836649 RepID=UPI001FBB476B|nr:precorrin-3B synthase [Methylobacterium sp. J-068]MCJ2036836.1 precorrin-3B synthase [Methylobacterium sp. J-068]
MTAPRRVPPEAPARRGWCPSLARPMPTGDGLLARIHPLLGRLTPGQTRAVAEGARRFGNGHIDVTARANLQVRGVGEATRCGLADHLAAVGLGDVRHDGGPQRLTLTTPLAGLESKNPIAVVALAETIEAAGLAVPGLPAKTLVAIEEASPHTLLGAAEADLHLVVTAEGLTLHPAGDAGWWRVAEADAPRVVDGALRMLAASGRRRIRDLDDGHFASFAEAFGLVPAPPMLDAPRLRPGLFPLQSGRVALLVDAPFGRCTAESLDVVADAAETLGPEALRLSPTRGLLLVAPGPAAAGAVRAALDEAGFLTRADDPRGAVAACPGAPACASGSTPTLRDAARLAGLLRPFAARGLRAHVSGCAKGCAHPGAADLTLVGRDGAYDVVLNGRPDALPATRLPFEAVLDRVRRADSALPLDRALSDPAFHEPAPGPRTS